MTEPKGLPSFGKLEGSRLWARVMYGPVRSRRLGLALGINLTPPRSKLCSFDCPYCECGRNTPKAEGEKWPSPDVVADALRKTLMMGAFVPDRVVIAGNGEPTMHPRFAVVVDRLLAARDEAGPGLPIGVLTNGLHARSPAVRGALDRLDSRWIKLDPGPPERVNGVTVDHEGLLEAWRGLRDVVVQAMVVEGPGWSGADEPSVRAWLSLLARLAPSGLHLYSLDRAPADPALKAVARERLEEIAVRARAVVNGPVAVF